MFRKVTVASQSYALNSTNAESIIGTIIQVFIYLE